MAGERQLPGLGLTGFWDLGSSGWNTGMDTDLLWLSVLVHPYVASRTADLPDPATQGDRYIVKSDATEHADEIAVYDNGEWSYIPPKAGMRVLVADTDTFVWYDGEAWGAEPAGTAVFPAYSSSEAGFALFVNEDGTAVEWKRPYPPITGEAGRVLTVNAQGTGVYWAISSSVPGGGDAGQYLTRDGEGVLVWSDLPGGGSAEYPTFTGNAGKVLAVNAEEDGVEWVDLPGAAVEDITGTTYTLVLADAGKFKCATNEAAVTITVPDDATVAFPVGSSITIAQEGAGQVTVEGATGVTIRTGGTVSPATREQYSLLTLVKRAADTWYLTGDMEIPE